MADQFDIAARRHLDTAETLERDGKLDDAGYHYGLAGETAVKQSIKLACGSLPVALLRHFAVPLRDAIKSSTEVSNVLKSGRLGGGLAADLGAGLFESRFDNWNVRIRYADSDFPVNAALVATWKADAVALMKGGVF